MLSGVSWPDWWCVRARGSAWSPEWPREVTRIPCTVQRIHIYLEYHSVCPLVRIGTPFPLARVSPTPPAPKGGETLLPAGEGVEGSQFGRQARKSLALCLLCALRTKSMNTIATNNVVVVFGLACRTTRGGSKCRVTVFLLSSCLVRPPPPHYHGQWDSPAKFALSYSFFPLFRGQNFLESMEEKSILFRVCSAHLLG